MSKKILNSILIFSIITVGFLRHYIFFNAHYAGLYIKKMYTKSRTDSWLQFLDHMTLEEIELLKWVFTIITLLLVFGISTIFTYFNYKKTRGTYFLFGSIFGFSFLAYILYLTGIPYTFQIARRALHFLQSPLPLILLFLHYQYLVPNLTAQK